MAWLLLASFFLPQCFLEPDPLELFRRWRRSDSPQLRIQAARTLRAHLGPEARVALTSLLDDDHAAVRAAAREELARRPAAEGPELAREIFALRDPRARLEGLRAILERKEDPTLFATDPDARVRTRALATGRVARPQVRAAWRSRDGPTRALALECLRAPELVPRAARDAAEEVRIAAARVTDDAAVLERLARDRSWRVRLAALRACERLRTREVVPILIRGLDEPPGRLCARALAALESVTQAGFGPDPRRWRSWWKSVERGFVVPERRARARPEATVAEIRFRRLPVVSRRLCFVLDASRSMGKPAPGGGGKSRWELVLRDLEGVLERLPSQARFNVVLFRTGVQAWRTRLVPATSGARAACRRWIQAEKPGGWTNLYDAVALALSDPDVDTLYLLTDGVPSRGAETERNAILDELAYLNRYRLVQVNCVQAGGSEGLGKKWEGFLEDLAAQHDGLHVRE